MNLVLLARLVPAVGLVGLALYHLSIADLPGAGTAVLAAAAAFGLHVTPPAPKPPTTS